MLLIANHAGNTFAFDGVMLSMAMLLDAEPVPEISSKLPVPVFQFGFGYLPVVDTCDDGLGTHTQILLDAPERKWNGYQNDDRPGDPPLCAIPDSL